MSIRISEEDFEQVVHDAGRCGLSVAGYARKKILGYRPQGQDIYLAIGELRRQGGLLKHLHNEGLGYGDKTASLLSLINATIRKINKEIERSEKRQSKEEV